MKRRYWAVAVGVLPLVPFACKTADSDVPNTEVPDLVRPATLALIVAPDDRVARVVPITVEARVRPTILDAQIQGLCVAITGKPGRTAFPFPSACTFDASTTPNPDAAPNGADASAEFSTSFACLSATPQPGGDLRAQTTAAYTRASDESAATLFGALYANAECTGEPIATQSVVAGLVGPVADAGVEARGEGGDATAGDSGLTDVRIENEGGPEAGDGSSE